MDTWLVTGSAGFLGANIGLWLQGKARRVGLSRSLAPSNLYDEQRAIDLRDFEATASYIREIRPNVIVHGAAISGHVTCAQDPEQARAVNVDATRVISQVASELGTRLIYISTDSVFSGDVGDYSETDPVSPFSYYGETKLEGESVVAGLVEKPLILRTNFFGWSMPTKLSVLEFFVESLREGKGVHGYPDSIVTSIYIRSLIETLWELEQSGASGIINVASRDALSKHDFGTTVALEFGLDPELIAPQPHAEQDSTTSRSRNISLNTTLLAETLGALPPSQSEGIHRARLEEKAVKESLLHGAAH